MFPDGGASFTIHYEVVTQLFLNYFSLNLYIFMIFVSFLQAIFELSKGEEDLIEDLKLAKKVCLKKKCVCMWG